jgi:hypothetical protein
MVLGRKEQRNMMRFGVAFATLGLLSATAVRLGADEALKPGLKPGDAPGSFNIKEVAGPDADNKGKSFCYT